MHEPHHNVPADSPATTLKVGSTVWVFDHNRRVYPKDKNGMAFGAPIWREHWVASLITGETRASWITAWGKFPKNPQPDGTYRMPQGGYTPLRVVTSEADIDEIEWVDVHAYRISERVRSSKDTATLRQIAKLIGYDDAPGGGR